MDSWNTPPPQRHNRIMVQQNNFSRSAVEESMNRSMSRFSTSFAQESKKADQTAYSREQTHATATTNSFTVLTPAKLQFHKMYNAEKRVKLAVEQSPSTKSILPPQSESTQ